MFYCNQQMTKHTVVFATTYNSCISMMYTAIFFYSQARQALSASFVLLCLYICRTACQDKSGHLEKCKDDFRSDDIQFTLNFTNGISD